MNEAKKLPYGHQEIDQQDIDAVVAILRGDWLTQGPTIEAFEKSVADHVGARHAVAFANGTAALHGAYHAAGVMPGDKVLTTPMTFAATSNAALYCGGEPVFCDISPDTLCMNPEEAARIAKSLPKPQLKAIAPVSYAGYPVDLAPFRALAQETGAVLIEDACHALGAIRDIETKEKVGTGADMTAFSFHPVKHITTGEGGMVVTNDDAFATKLRLFRSHGITRDRAQMVNSEDQGSWASEMLDLGYNYRLTDIACALGLSQMKRLDAFVEKRRTLAARYRENWRSESRITLPPAHPGHAYHLFPAQVDPKIRKDVFEALRADGIGVQVHYLPVHLHPYYRKRFGYSGGEYPHAEAFYARTISLPIFPSMDASDVDRVTSFISARL